MEQQRQQRVTVEILAVMFIARIKLYRSQMVWRGTVAPTCGFLTVRWGLDDVNSFIPFWERFVEATLKFKMVDADKSDAAFCFKMDMFVGERTIPVAMGRLFLPRFERFQQRFGRLAQWRVGVGKNGG